MNKKYILISLLFIISFNQGIVSATDDTDMQLRDRGFSIIPRPQQVFLKPENVVVDETWQVISKVGDDIAVKELIKKTEELHSLKFSNNRTKQIILSVKAGIVKGTDDPELNKQGYLLTINNEEIQITGNSRVGLFYGVQSLLQLMHHAPGNSSIILPEGEIRDWPDLQLRFIHWHTKNHLDRMPVLKEYIDRLARLKINMISFEIWDKFRFPTDPEIGVKEGFTPAQLQELVNYGLERHIQIVPNVQAPAHMQWVLKHERYAHLRADGSDYQACMCDPETNKLIFSLYQDLIDATKGVDYFHASTD
ncbi:MAG TPA: beta-N-acetylhexosaminidase [Paludibacteraceae bacterium]|mgnify:CR=1 FL=1|nr:beta-N-acetylhexosaminidase [Paludibacteraceae bacterium]HQK71985.1 beta-N-acetylhexosaminidase [Bacteroidales bacterium]